MNPLRSERERKIRYWATYLVIGYLFGVFVSYGQNYNNADMFSTYTENHRRYRAFIEALTWPLDVALVPLDYIGNISIALNKHMTGE